MSEPTMETLARRLDGVERENRWLKGAGVVALAVIAAVVLMGQATTGKVVEAEMIFLRDAKGKFRGALGVNSDGTVFLGLADMDGTGRAQMSVSADGSANLVFRDKTNNPRVGLTHSGDGSTTFLLADKGEPRFTLALGADGSLSLNLYQEGGLNFWDKAGENRLVLGVSGDGLSHLTLSDKAGVIRAELGRTSLETEQTGVVQQRPESSLVLFDKAGKVIWSPP